MSEEIPAAQTQPTEDRSHDISDETWAKVVQAREELEKGTENV